MTHNKTDLKQKLQNIANYLEAKHPGTPERQ